LGSIFVTTSVILAGGLGNQLFQLAAGWHVAQDSKLVLETGILTPNASGKTELTKLNLPENIVIQDSSTRPKFEKRVISYCIRHSAKTIQSFNHKVIEMIATVVISSLRRRATRVFLNNGLGLDSRIERIHGDVMLIGYFQCYQWATSVKSKLNLCLTMFRDSDEVRNCVSGMRQPFNMMHLRLGDYLQENKFGIPSENYFLSSIKRLEAEVDQSQRFFLFTDSPEIISRYLPNLLNSLSLFNPPENFEALENLIVMSSAKNFIISNSTYSWWAAFLSEHKEAKVYAPDPWFHDLKAPSGLIPANWITINSGLMS
jgi:hypothetical protein